MRRSQRKAVKSSQRNMIRTAHLNLKRAVKGRACQGRLMAERK